MSHTTASLNDIYKFFQDPPPSHLNQELAICYGLFVLLQKDAYSVEIIQRLKTEYPAYRLSDRILSSALGFLEKRSVVIGYWQKAEGRGRPRRMYHIQEDWRDKAKQLADLWESYVAHDVIPKPIECGTNFRPA
ncbi:MAG: PadR family transcriptional regulator [Cyanobacteria bacterium P01_A01_bin.37]